MPGWFPDRAPEPILKALRGWKRDGELTIHVSRIYRPGEIEFPYPIVEYALHRDGHSDVIGSVAARLRPSDEARKCFFGHVGYGVEEEHRSHGFAGRACRMIWPLFTACGISEVWVRAEVENIASCRTLERLGGKRVERIENIYRADLPDEFVVKRFNNYLIRPSEDSVRLPNPLDGMGERSPQSREEKLA